MEKTKAQLQENVGLIQQKIENLKTLNDELEKKIQLERVKQEIHSLKQEIIKSDLDDAEKEDFLDSLTIFSGELGDLKDEII